MSAREVFPGVTVNPEVKWGQPCVVGVPTRAIADRFRAGEHVADLAADYDLPAGRIEAALRWELQTPRTRQKRLAGAARESNGPQCAQGSPGSTQDARG